MYHRIVRPFSRVPLQLRDIVEQNREIKSEQERYQLMAYSAYNSFKYPTQAQHIATLGELTSYSTLIDIHQRMMATESGRRILKQKPRVRTPQIDLKYLDSLPDGTFGKEYSRFMSQHGLSADDRPVVTMIGDLQLAYVYQRYKEIHDYLHVLLGLGITEKDEIALKWYEMGQLGLPSCTMAALVGGLRLGAADVLSLSAQLPSLMQQSTHSSFVMAVPFEEHFQTELGELRRLVQQGLV